MLMALRMRMSSRIYLVKERDQRNKPFTNDVITLNESIVSHFILPLRLL